MKETKTILDMMDQDACRDYLIGLVHPDGPVCPDCGYVPKARPAATWRRGGRVKCYACGKFYTVWTGTIFSAGRLNPRQLVLLIFMSQVCQSTDPIIDVLGVSRETVWAWMQKIDLAKAYGKINSPDGLTDNNSIIQ